MNGDNFITCVIGNSCGVTGKIITIMPYSKTCVKGPLSKRPKIGFQDYHLMQVKSIAECSFWEHSAILSTFIKLPFVIKIFVLSIFEWPLYTGFTVFTLTILTP